MSCWIPDCSAGGLGFDSLAGRLIWLSKTFSFKVRQKILYTEVPMDEPVELSPDTSMCGMIQHEFISIAIHNK